MKAIKTLALKLAHTKPAKYLLAWGFTHMSQWLPVERLHETDTLLAFYHPRPSYLFHVLLVPKKGLGGLGDIRANDAAFLTDLFEAVQILVDKYGLEKAGYRLIANGGRYQETPQLHFHLIAETDLNSI